MMASSVFKTIVIRSMYRNSLKMELCQDFSRSLRALSAASPRICFRDNLNELSIIKVGIDNTIIVVRLRLAGDIIVLQRISTDDDKSNGSQDFKQIRAQI